MVRCCIYIDGRLSPAVHTRSVSIAAVYTSRWSIVQVRVWMCHVMVRVNTVVINTQTTVIDVSVLTPSPVMNARILNLLREVLAFSSSRLGGISQRYQFRTALGC